MNRIAFEEAEIRQHVLKFDQPCHIVEVNGRIGACHHEEWMRQGTYGNDPIRLVATAPLIHPAKLGDQRFQAAHGARFNYYAGAMANGIASEEMVIALGREGILGSFGAGGLLPARIESAIQQIQTALPNGPYAFNLIHSPQELAMERNAVDLYLRYGVRTIEASAFMNLTPSLVRYRVAGLELRPDGSIEIRNRIIAKISREQVAEKSMSPPPAHIVAELLQAGQITPLQANLARRIPMADDITVEADSGGHTDNRPFLCLLPTMIRLRDDIQARYGYAEEVRVGAAGGIGTPIAALGAFMMGAAYIGTGSVNQSCMESGVPLRVKQMLSEASVADVTMAPASDMFEMGVRVQVLKQGTLFPTRAQKLFSIYKSVDSIDDIPAQERIKLEQQIFRRNLDEIWQECVSFFQERDPEQIERALHDEKRKMALIFRWYLGLSSRWAIRAEAGRETDYQIWCGPAMGSFNEWVKGTSLEPVEGRRVARVAQEMMQGATYLYRIEQLRMAGAVLPAGIRSYVPEASVVHVTKM